jgi:cytoskeletal protein RodZ
MSAPDTNLERQKENHKGPLSGIWLSLIVVAVLFVGWLLWYAVSPDSDDTGGPVTEPAVTAPAD